MNFPRFPKSSDFSSWDEYSDAAQTWYHETIDAVRDRRLPLPLSSHVHIPVRPLQNAQRGIVKRVFDPSKNPPLPEGNLEMLDVVIDGTPFEDLTTSNNAPMSAYISPKAHWGSELIEPEPIPEMFDDFDAYFEAMRSWKDSVQGSFVHPHNLKETIDSDFQETGSPVVEKSGSPFSLEHKGFDGSRFLQMPQWENQETQLFQNLFEDLNSRTVITGTFSDGHPFGGKMTARQLVDLLSGGNTVEKKPDLAKQLEKYKVWADPTLDDKVTEFTGEVEMETDLSLSQFMIALQTITDPQAWISERQHRICFVLSNLHLVKSNRYRGRMFLLLTKMLKLKPSLTLSLFFWSDESIVNVTRLFVDFSNDYSAIQPCRSLECVRDNIPLRTLYTLLLSYQLLVTLENKHLKGKSLRNEIASRQNMHKEEIKSHIISNSENFEDFFSHSEIFEHAEIQFDIINMILDFDSSMIDYLFPPVHGKSVWVWLGTMKSNERTAPFYGNTATHILRRSDLRAVFLNKYFASESVAPIASQMILLSQCARLVAILLKSQLTMQVEWEVCNTLLVRTVHLLEYNPLHVIELISAICLYYSRQLGGKMKVYAGRLGEFRISLLNVFVSRSLTVEQLTVLLKGMSLLLFEERDMSTIFASSFLPILAEFMGSSNPDVLKTAWGVFTQWYANDRSVEIALADDEELKQTLTRAVQLAKQTEEGAALVAKLSKDPLVRRRRSRRRKKDGQDILSMILQAHSLGVACTSSLQNLRTRCRSCSSKFAPRRRSFGLEGMPGL